jgi:hypothetical protein
MSVEQKCSAKFTHAAMCFVLYGRNIFCRFIPSSINSYSSIVSRFLYFNAVLAVFSILNLRLAIFSEKTLIWLRWHTGTGTLTVKSTLVGCLRTRIAMIWRISSPNSDLFATFGSLAGPQVSIRFYQGMVHVFKLFNFLLLLVSFLSDSDVDPSHF